MRMIRRIGAYALLLAMVVMTVGCGKSKKTITPIAQNEYETALTGKWAYIHDTKTPVAEFEVDGTLKFESTSYTYTSDNQFIYMKSKDGAVTKLRYEMDPKTHDRMYVYIQGTYTRQHGSAEDGIVGVWREESKNWMFEFSDKNTFMEEEAMTGYYEVNEEAGTVKLMYGEALEDTIFYYELTGDELFVEYPWLMVRM